MNWGKKKTSLERQRDFISDHIAQKRIFPYVLWHLHSSPSPHCSYGTMLITFLFFFFSALPYTRLHFSSSGSKAAIFNLNRLAAHLAPLNHGPRKQSVCIAPAAVFCLIYFYTRWSSIIWEWPSLPYSFVWGGKKQ